jgi:hypothetical protein
VLHDRVERVEPVERLLVVDIRLRLNLDIDLAFSFDVVAGGSVPSYELSGYCGTVALACRPVDSGARRTIPARVLAGSRPNGQSSLS